MEKELAAFQSYLESVNKSQSTIQSYPSHIKRILSIEGIKTKGELLDRIGFIDYNIRYGDKYKELSKSTKDSYCSALNCFFNFAFEEYELIKIKIKEKNNFTEQDCLSLNEAFASRFHELKIDREEYLIIIKRVRKGCLICTIGIVTNCIKNGFKLIKLIHQIIKDAKQHKLDLATMNEYAVDTAKIIVDIAMSFFKSFDVSSIIMDSLEIGKEIAESIMNALEKIQFK